MGSWRSCHSPIPSPGCITAATSWGRWRAKCNARAACAAHSRCCWRTSINSSSTTTRTATSPVTRRCIRQRVPAGTRLSSAARASSAHRRNGRGANGRHEVDHPIIRVQHVVKSFGKVTAVNDVSFDVHPGEIFAFLGPNGAGKTTTIKMLTTLLHPTSGALELDGLDPTTHATEVRRRFGVVFQDPSLDSELTAWENMDIHGVLYHVPRQIRRERAETLLKMFELWDRHADLVKAF